MNDTTPQAPLPPPFSAPLYQLEIANELADLSAEAFRVSAALLDAGEPGRGARANHIGYRLDKLSDSLRELAGEFTLSRAAAAELGELEGQVLLADAREAAAGAVDLFVEATTEPSWVYGDEPSTVHVLMQRRPKLEPGAPAELERHSTWSGVRRAAREHRRKAVGLLSRAIALEAALAERSGR